MSNQVLRLLYYPREHTIIPSLHLNPNTLARMRFYLENTKKKHSGARNLHNFWIWFTLLCTDVQNLSPLPQSKKSAQAPPFEVNTAASGNWVVVASLSE